MKFADAPGIDVYPVGMLAALRMDWRRIVEWRRIPRKVGVGTHVRRNLGYIRYQIRARNWRAVRMNFNGYLAEPTPLPDGLTRCGSGWTKRRALASLARHASEARAASL